MKTRNFIGRNLASACHSEGAKRPKNLLGQAAR
jgi:hypothetical protein